MDQAYVQFAPSSWIPGSLRKIVVKTAGPSIRLSAIEY